MVLEVDVVAETAAEAVAEEGDDDPDEETEDGADGDVELRPGAERLLGHGRRADDRAGAVHVDEVERGQRVVVLLRLLLEVLQPGLADGQGGVVRRGGGLGDVRPQGVDLVVERLQRLRDVGPDVVAGLGRRLSLELEVGLGDVRAGE